MAQIKYIGPHDAVSIPALGIEVKSGDAFDAGTLTKSLLEQDTFEAVKAAAKGKES